MHLHHVEQGVDVRQDFAGGYVRRIRPLAEHILPVATSAIGHLGGSALKGLGGINWLRGEEREELRLVASTTPWLCPHGEGEVLASRPAPHGDAFHLGQPFLRRGAGGVHNHFSIPTPP
ncbi:MAG: hypothetical protein HY906_15045 [Deltaproteobacteria bacterium]|nr:hypothetical protein [Deltaproteobacteria bacterium]